VSPPSYELPADKSKYFKLINSYTGISTTPTKQNIVSLGVQTQANLYTANLFFQKPNFINQIDNKLFMSLAAKLKVTLSYPISIQVYNNSFIPLSLAFETKNFTTEESITTLSKQGQNIDDENYTLDIFNKIVSLKDVSSFTILNSISNIFTIVENKILLSNVECYKIQILDLIVFVPKETQIFNGESFTKINLKSDKFYFNGQIINNFKITDEIANITLLDSDYDYLYSGLCIINPIYLQNYKKQNLNLSTRIFHQNKIRINSAVLSFIQNGRYSYAEINQKYAAFERITLKVHNENTGLKIIYRAEKNVFFDQSCNIESRGDFKIAYFNSRIDSLEFQSKDEICLICAIQAHDI